MWGSWCVFNVWAWDLSRDICHQPCEIPAKFAAEFSFFAFARGFSVPNSLLARICCFQPLFVFFDGVVPGPSGD